MSESEFDDAYGRSTPLPSEPRRAYTLPAVWLHWLTAILVMATLPVAWIMSSLPDNDPRADTYFTIHKSLGVTIFVLVVLRLLWRAIKPAPDLPHDIPPWQALAARINHWLLYAILLVMALSGYLLTVAAGYPLSYFGLFDVPGFGKYETLANVADTLHVLGRFLVYLFVAVHILAAIWHVAVRRDGTLNRILPPQR
ncbi:cytochrome b561 [Arboricoccus pini]|uniref:Cytochrome b561 n=1 Tax=Arboricoccus pini TaxID=1963835 RepID=A0A212PX80_9PROT|nr:cytochrome b [Arboricoccus pini]SNB51662.1 cytochrome b561 [Arboricoccus pini]